MGDKIGKRLEQVLMLNEALGQKLNHNWTGAHLHLTLVKTHFLDQALSSRSGI
jgi:hypothetical protein